MVFYNSFWSPNADRSNKYEKTNIKTRYFSRGVTKKKKYEQTILSTHVFLFHHPLNSLQELCTYFSLVYWKNH